MKAIPTIYNGQLFRSRLEAKWACFFDMVGWQWEYEPFDLNGWIPDFLIKGSIELLCDVKPTLSFMPDVAQKMERAIDPKTECRELLLISMAPFLSDEWCGWSIGWLQESGLSIGWKDSDGNSRFLGDWGPAMLGYWKAGNGILGLCHGVQSYRDRISGGYDGGCYGELDLNVDPTMVWRKACNEVMWNRPETVSR